MEQKPIIFMAFANERTGIRFLSELKREENALRDLIVNHPLCEREIKTVARRDDIYGSFLQHKERIKVFHFSGHGGEEGIQLETEYGENEMAFVRGVAAQMAFHKGVRLVFLNACATEAQIQAFHDVQIPVVIATRRPVQDKVARVFSVNFYKAFMEGYSIKDAYDQAINSLYGLTKKPEELFRGFKKEKPETDLIPYILSQKNGAAGENLHDWQKDTEPEAFVATVATPEKGKKSDCSEKEYLRCNRKDQRKQFERMLTRMMKAETNFPQTVFMYGQREEVPKSLANCLRTFGLPKILRADQELATSYKSISFPPKGDFMDAPERPLETLMEEYSHIFKLPIHTTPDHRVILNRITQRRKVLWIEHALQAENWPSKGMHEFLKNYLTDFWGHALTPKDPWVIINIHISYPKNKGFFRSTKAPKQIVNCLEALAKEIPRCLLLPELESVARHEVEEWRIDKFDQPQYHQLVQDVFGSKKTLPMSLIERKLASIVQAASQRYGREI